MNIFCIISWTSWFNGRRLITALYETEKLIIDFAYTVIGFYSLIIIIIIVLDYYGSVWEGSPLLKNKLLVYLLGMDFITIASDITKNLFTGCDINMLCEN